MDAKNLKLIARTEGINKVLFPPTFIPLRPCSQPSITCLNPI